MITFAMLSDKGERSINEDYVGYVTIGPDNRLFALADGLGGHGRGEDASAFVTEKSKQIYRQSFQAVDCLEQCFIHSQNALLEKQAIEYAQGKLKTTLVLLKFSDDTMQWGHIGDSRLYFFHKGKILSRTLDHSVPQILVNAGQIEENEIRYHPDRNKLIYVMGTKWENQPFQISKKQKIKKDSAFLLCSDGFWEYIEDKEMEECLKQSKNVSEWLMRMKKIVKQRGMGKHMDNYSAIAIKIQK